MKSESKVRVVRDNKGRIILKTGELVGDAQILKEKVFLRCIFVISWQRE